MSNPSRNKILVLLLFILPLFFAVPAFAQKNGDVKKSTKIETIDGKKYYDHTVLKGQTLYAISKAYGLTVNDILLENPDALNGIHPGQVLKIPFEKTTPKVITPLKGDTTYFIHKVEAGQTLYSIAHLYNITEQEITTLNPEAKNGLKIGQELKIPGKKNGNATTNIVGNGLDTMYRGNKKPMYNVALMLPLQLWNVDNINTDEIIKPNGTEFPQKSKAAVEFYEGTLIAIDSMRRTGMKVTLHVYDVDDADSAKVQTTLAKPEFASMDLIIGPLSPGPFYTVSNWAKDHHVAIVSPVSPANKVLFKRPDAVKALPSLSTQMDELAMYVGTNHKSDNVIMVTSGNVKEQAAANSFRVNVSKILYPAGGDTIKTTRGMSGLEALLKKDKANVLVVPSGSQTFVSDLLRSLNTLSDKYVIVVYGLSNWMSFDNLDQEYLQKLQFHFVAPYFIDYDSSATTQKFLDTYNYTFKGDASLYAFAGYDVSLFFMHELFLYGTDFYEKLPAEKSEGLQQNFEFYKTDDESGYENRGVRIVQVVDYKLVRVK